MHRNTIMAHQFQDNADILISQTISFIVVEHIVFCFEKLSVTVLQNLSGEVFSSRERYSKRTSKRVVRYPEEVEKTNLRSVFPETPEEIATDPVFSQRDG